MLRVQFRNFRCFTQSASVEIRPITLLIGENSAGKTSFLAGLRFLFEGLSGGSQNIFNKDPYFLGGFEEIAHRSRGKPATQFIIRADIAEDRTSHQFTFSRGEPQPELSAYEFTCGDDRVLLNLSGERHATITFQFSGLSGHNGVIDLGDDQGLFPPAPLVRSNPFYLSMVFQYLSFRGHNRPSKRASNLPDERISKLSHHFEVSRQHLQKNVFASAPVRTQPRRTYTPSEVTASSEGDQVPLALARAKLREPEKWKQIQKNLASFGRDSGLYTNIDIRQFGKSDIDPFQVLVRLGNSRRNLVDVGYGISQVLPIVYQIQMAGIYNTFLLQQPEIHLHPRAQAELSSLMVHKLDRNHPRTFVVETHSDYIIDRLRILIGTQSLDPDDVTLIFFERHDHDCSAVNIYIDRSGELVGIPPNFRTFFIQEHSRLLGL
jgi:AAA ATPase domain